MRVCVCVVVPTRGREELFFVALETCSSPPDVEDVCTLFPYFANTILLPIVNTAVYRESITKLTLTVKEES